jgi:hypothetical protein
VLGHDPQRVGEVGDVEVGVDVGRRLDRRVTGQELREFEVAGVAHHLGDRRMPRHNVPQSVTGQLTLVVPEPKPAERTITRMVELFEPDE